MGTTVRLTFWLAAAVVIECAWLTAMFGPGWW